VEAAMSVMTEDMINGLRSQIGHIPKGTAVFFGMSRSASEFISPKMWNKFVFPYVKRMIEAIVAEGSPVYLHVDSNWERDLARFKEFPKGKCVIHTDHKVRFENMEMICFAIWA
jgi:hypothetical protein